MNPLTPTILPPHIADEYALEELLSRPSQALIDDLQRLFSHSSVPLETMIDWTADWIERDQPAYTKPTRFEVCDGRS
ncbi:MAG: hypothetical protein OXK81_15425 [Chloroflexota bacterium]|nr:hypothetical protein [Chloroflexota bacterium]MDE2929393.1 hypothetical protein [Chloroflexota bacterium]